MSLFNSYVITKDIFNDIQQDRYTPFKRYVENNSSNINRIRDIYDNTLLHITVRANRPRLVMLLLENGADQNALNNFNETAFSIANIYGFTSVAKTFQEFEIQKLVREKERRIDDLLIINQTLNIDLSDAKRRKRQLEDDNCVLDKDNKKLKRDVQTYQDLLKKK